MVNAEQEITITPVKVLNYGSLTMTSLSPSQELPPEMKCQVTCEASGRESKSLGERNPRSLSLFGVKEGRRIGHGGPGKVWFCYLLNPQLKVFPQLFSLSHWLLFLCYFFIFLKYIYLFIFWLCWVFVAARGLSLVVESGGYSSLWCVGFSLWWLLLLRSTGSRCAGFSSCVTRAQ